MIKPDATSKGFTGAILDKILKSGFTIKAMKWTKLTREQAGAFYEVHKKKYIEKAQNQENIKKKKKQIVVIFYI